MGEFCVVIAELKEQNGVIADAIIAAGVDVYDFTMYETFKDYDYVLYFYNKVPPAFKVKGETAWWMCDFRSPTELENTKPFNCDKIFICHQTYDKEYQDYFGAPVHYLPQIGLNQSIIKGRDINWDIVFLGTVNEKKRWHKGREEVLKYLSSTHRLKHISGEKDSVDQMWIYNQSPVSLSMSFPMEYGVSNRLYNILASAGFCLTQHFPGIERLFEKGVHLEWFQDKEEIPEIVDFYMKNTCSRINIGLRAYGLFMQKHCAEQRMKNALALMREETTEFWGWND